MRHITLTDIYNNTYTRISKQRAIKRHLAGDNVYVLPCYIRCGTPWYPAPHCIPRELDTLQGLTAFLKAYTWSNCNEKTGYYIAYYIKQGE